MRERLRHRIALALERVDPQVERRPARERGRLGGAVLSESAREMWIEPLRIVAGDPRRGAVEASPLESLALLGAQRTRRVAAVLGEASDRGRVEPALEREHAERDRARGVLVHQEGGGGFAPQRVIDQAGDRGTVAGT